MKFRVFTPSDGQPNEHIWRDAWVRSTLVEALKAEGADYSAEPVCDLNIYLHGWVNRPIDPKQNNVLWLIGHPDIFLEILEKQRREFLSAFSRIFCASLRFCEKLRREHKVEAEWLVCPPPPRGDCMYRPVHELAFVGNCDPAKSRPKLTGVLRAHDSVVYGAGWRKALNNSHWRADYIDFAQLDQVWNSAQIVPYSTHEDMRREGFVADACLDAMANSGALVLPDHNSGFESLGIDAVKTWGEEEQLAELVRRYLFNEPERGPLQATLRRQAARFTYEHVAKKFMESV
jgi:hypothetical protein